MRSGAIQCNEGEITFCIQPGSANSPRSSILSQDFDLLLVRLKRGLRAVRRFILMTGRQAEQLLESLGYG
jgi:hypothetical protein